MKRKTFIECLANNQRQLFINNQTADEEFKNTVRDGLSQAKTLINGHMTSKDDFWIEDIESGYLAGKLFEIDSILEQI